jgi:hypothetical protein
MSQLITISKQSWNTLSYLVQSLQVELNTLEEGRRCPFEQRGVCYEGLCSGFY